MSKDIGKKAMTKQTHRYNHQAINAVASSFGVTKVYVRQCINGTRQGATCDTIKKKYYTLVAKFELVIKNQE